MLAAAVAGGALLAALSGPAARKPVERFLSARLHRPVRIVGGLKLHLLSAAPEADFYDLRVGQPAWAGPGEVVRIAHLHVAMPWSALTGGPLRFEALELDRPVVHLLRLQDGRSNWSFDAGTQAGTPLQLPFVRRLTIRDGRLGIDDRPRGAAFAGPVYTDASGSLRLRVAGTLKGGPFSLALDGAPLSGLRPDQPYVLAGDTQAGTRQTGMAQTGMTRLRVRVTLARPFDFGHVMGEAQASGDTLHGLAEIIGVPLPNTPRYTLAVRISRDAAHYGFEGLRGRVGGSDVSGALRLDSVGGRRRLTGALRSEHLQLGDLLAVIGGQSGAPQALAKRAADARRPGPHWLLPDGPIKPSWFRGMDMRLGFASSDVRAGRLPLRRLSFNAGLQRGVLSVRPLRMQFARGVFDGGVRMDARTDLPASRLEGRFTGFRSEDVLALLHSPQALDGALDGRVDLHGRGLSVHKAAAAADGGAVFVMGPGQAQESYSRLLGGDMVGAMGELKRRDSGGTALRCAAIGLRASGGRARVGALTIDTAPTVMDGSGVIDLGAESLSVRLTGRAKQPRLFHVAAPVTLAGPWRHVRVGVDRSRLVEAGVAGVASTLLSPLKALLPGLGPAPAADVDCRALYARAAAVSGAAAATRGRQGRRG